MIMTAINWAPNMVIETSKHFVYDVSFIFHKYSMKWASFVLFYEPMPHF